MIIVVALISILTLSALTWLANRVLPFTVCPICAGVSLTWLGLIGAHIVGYQIALTIPALLMGGSVVGIAQQLEKRARHVSSDARMLWKTLFIPTGFVAAYAVLEQWWVTLLFAVVFLAGMSMWFVSSKNTARREGVAKDIENKMKDCC